MGCEVRAGLLRLSGQRPRSYEAVEELKTLNGIPVVEWWVFSIRGWKHVVHPSGKPIAQHQTIQIKLAVMATKIEASRLLIGSG